MEIQHSMRDGCLVLSFTGGIDLLSVSAVQRTVLKTSATPVSSGPRSGAVRSVKPIRPWPCSGSNETR
jgi:hypothetical protein